MLSSRAAYKIAFALVLWRACLAVIVRTSFDPDEYWQGPEVAHRLVFGYGHLTWEWAAGLRSYAHPLLFTPGLIFLQLFRLDTPAAVQLAPRVTQILLSLAHDAVLFCFARTHLPVHLQLPTLLVSSLSWFNCFTHTRPFSNCVESTLHLAALTAWPRINYPASISKSGNACVQPPHRRILRAIAVLLAGLCCVIRPPACVLFLPIAVFEVLHVPALPSKKHPGLLARAGHAAAYICDCLALAAFILITNGMLDRHFYGRWVFPAWVNLEFNVLQNSSADYGTHPAHWYFSQGLPAMLGSLLPLTMWGVWAAVKSRCSTGAMPRWPLILGLWGVAMHSVLPHKEFRYILPSFELILMYAAVPLISSPPSVSSIEGKELTSADQTQTPTPAHAQTPAQTAGLRQRLASKADPDGNVSLEKGGASSQRSATEHRWRKGVAVAAVGLQLPMLLYFGVVHQRGTVAVMEHLSKAHIPSAHMHRADISMTFLDCSPPEWHEAARAQNAPSAIGVTAATGGEFRDEQRAFEADPMHWLCMAYGCRADEEQSVEAVEEATCSLDSGACGGDEAPHEGLHRQLPLYITLYKDMEAAVLPFLSEHGYQIEAAFLQNMIEEQYVLLYKLDRHVVVS